jgi:hypothetical protein
LNNAFSSAPLEIVPGLLTESEFNSQKMLAATLSGMMTWAAPSLPHNLNLTSSCSQQHLPPLSSISFLHLLSSLSTTSTSISVSLFLHQHDCATILTTPEPSTTIKMVDNPVPPPRCYRRNANKRKRTEEEKQRRLDKCAQWRADNPAANAEKIRVRDAKQRRKEANKARREAEAAATAVSVSALDKVGSGGSASSFPASALGQTSMTSPAVASLSALREAVVGLSVALNTFFKVSYYILA